jgi:hypothetical protein
MTDWHWNTVYSEDFIAGMNLIYKLMVRNFDSAERNILGATDRELSTRSLTLPIERELRDFIESLSDKIRKEIRKPHQ